MLARTTGRCLAQLEKCKNMKQLKQAHAQAITTGLGENSYALSRLLAFCSDPFHGGLTHGLTILQHVRQPTHCIFNTMIKACLLEHEFEKAILLYKDMMGMRLYPDNYTFPSVLKACANMEKIYSHHRRHLGELIHGHTLRLGLSFDSFVGNSLISMYSSFGDMVDARQVFDEMPVHCVVSWTVLISGCARIGDVDAARLVFDEAPVKDRGIWGAMISGYVQNNCFKEGLQMFRLMQSAGITPDEAMFVSLLSACAHLGALEIGLWIHRLLDRLKLRKSVRIGTALMDMYAKCGKMDLAAKVFDEMPERDTICWNVMISGAAMHGNGSGALELFSEMEKAGIEPDDITFIAVFSACSYSGMEYEGLRLFHIMCNVYNIEPKIEHYACVVDFLGRAGLFEEVKEIIRRLPDSCSPSEEAVAWRALLSACQGHGQIELAEIAAKRLMDLESHSGAYVLLYNLYSNAGKHDSSRRIRNLMTSQGIDKTPGCSSIEVNNVVHEFVAGEKTHPWTENIHALIVILNKQLKIHNIALLDHGWNI